jgi:hypothetical protein
LVSPARSELITFEFTGTVTSVSIQNGFGLQNFDFPDVGDSFTGFYTFDSNAQDTADSPGQGSFKTLLPSRAIVTMIGDFEFEGRANVIVATRDQYAVGDHIPSIELTSNPALAQILSHHNFSLAVGDEDLFEDPNVLPVTPPSLIGTQHGLYLSMDSQFNHGDWPLVEIYGSLDSLAVIPEPRRSILVLIAIGILLVWRNRTHRVWT